MSRILDSSKTDENFDSSLRPLYMKEYIGQDEIKENLKIFIGAAKNRNETLDHVLLYGPPGLGKTTLANVIANELEANFRSFTATSIEKIGDLAAILSEVQAGDVVFIDEIHRLPRIVEESLYSAMEDYRFDIIVSNDMNSKCISLDLPPFTLIGATTRAGSLSAPLRSRFGITIKLNLYTTSELAGVVRRTSKVFSTSIDPLSVKEIAMRSRGTPRIANRIFKRVRDYANYYDSAEINYEITKRALTMLKIDSLGLDEVDIKYLKSIIYRFKGGPVGLETLASSIGEEKDNLEDVYEPFLLQIGFIDKTPKGRIVTSKAYRHLQISKE